MVNVLLPLMAKMADQSREKQMVQNIQDDILIVLNIMSYNMQVCKATMENCGLPTKTTKDVKKPDSTF